MDLLNVASEKDKLVDWGYNKIYKSKKKKAEEEMEERKMGQRGSVTKRKREVRGKEKEQIYFITFKTCLVSTYSVRST